MSALWHVAGQKARGIKWTFHQVLACREDGGANCCDQQDVNHQEIVIPNLQSLLGAKAQIEID